MDQIKNALWDALTPETFVKLVFSDPRKKSIPYKKVTLRPVLLQGVQKYQVEYHYNDHVTQENLDREEAFRLCVELVVRDYKQINLFTTAENVQMLASNPANPKITRVPSEKDKPALSHNQAKKYLIPDGIPCDFLIRLGVMDEGGKVFQKHYSKFRQINRFLEIVSDCASFLPADADKPVRIVDFGCGKAYLTFALYHYLKVVLNREVSIVGLDLKQNVIDFCNKTAEALHYDSLTFLVGDIADYRSESADMVVTLHACDTATDAALVNAAAWDAKVILSVPCCQHELFGQLKNDLHEPMLRHGILKDRFTEILTDGLRGLALEARGYEVAMIEFTSLEHTSKNIMIKAILPPGKSAVKMKKALAEYENLTAYWQVTPAIQALVE